MAVYNVSKARSKVAGTASNDRMTNSRYRNVTMVGGNGNDSIKNAGRNSYISGGNGNDSIWNTGYVSKIDAGAGNDRIYNSGDEVSIFAGNGNDSIKNDEGYYSTISGGAGNDTIVDVDGYENVISGGAGNDVISLTAYSEGINIRYSSGAGNDRIYGFNSDDVLEITSGNITAINKVNTHLILTVGSGKITLMGAAGKSLDIRQSFKSTKASSKITGASYNDSVQVNHQRVTVASGAGNDTIKVSGSSALISAGTGNDLISLTSAARNTAINYSGGNDTIYGMNSDDALNVFGTIKSSSKSGSTVILTVGSSKIYLINAASQTLNIRQIFNSSKASTKITGGNYNDSIQANHQKVTVSSGAGNDTIKVSGSSSSILAGAGNDIISLTSAARNTTIKYTSGNDTIFGFNADDKLQITGSWSSVKSGSSTIVKVGSSQLLLYGYIPANERVNVGSSNSNIITGNGRDTVYNPNYSNVKISTGAGNDSIFNYSGSSAVINAGAGNDTIRNTGLNVSINAETGNDYIYNTGSYASIDAGDGNDSIYNYYGRYSTINAGNGNDSIFNYSALVTVDAGTGNDSIISKAYYVSINGGDGSDYIFSNGAFSTINAGTGINTINVAGSNTSILSSNGSDLISLSSSAKNTALIYSGGNSTVYGFNDDDKIDIKSSSWSSSASSNGASGNTTIQVGSSHLILAGYIGKVNLFGSSVSVNASNKNVVTGDGNDTIFNQTYSNVNINTGNGDDSVYNYKGNLAVINTGNGNDTILNGSWNVNKPSYYPNTGGDSVRIDSGNGDDKIFNVGNNVSIYAGNGNDTIYSYESKNVLVDAGTGNDYINARMVNSTILAGDGNDYVNNYLGSNVSIDAGTGNDIIRNNGGQHTSINAGIGNDVVSLEPSASLTTINYKNGDGNDTVYGFKFDDTLNITGSWSSVKSGSSTLIEIGSGHILLAGYISPDENVSVGSSDSSITTGVGNDTVYNPGFIRSNINTGAGNDSVFNYKGSSAVINTGIGNDTILNGQWNVNKPSYYPNTGGVSVSINAGDGDDKIYHVGSYAVIDADSGSDTIFSYSANGSVNAGDGNDFVNNGGIRSNVLLGSGMDKIYNYGSESTIDGGAGNDLIWNGVSQVSINAGTGNDVISLISSAENTTISSAENTTINYSRGDGNDTIYGFDSDDILRISEGTWLSKKIGSDFVLTVGSDTISMIGVGSTAIQIAVGNGPVTTINSDSVIQSFLNSLGSALVSGGNYNDSLYNSGDNSTLDGGLGNDILTGHNGADVFLFSGGNDTVTNYSSEDTIQIANGKVNDYLFDKGDLILFADDGTIRLKNMTNHYIIVSDSTGTSKKLYTNGMTQQTVIKNIMQTLKSLKDWNGITALDTAVKNNTHFTGIQAALNQFLSDFNSSGGGSEFLQGVCGIFLDNDDTGAITGWDAGGSTVKTNESIIQESGSWLQPSGNSFTVNGVTLKYDGSLTQNQQTIFNGIYTWWMKNSLDLIKESYGLEPQSKSMTLNFTNDAKSGLLATCSPTQLMINEYYYSSVNSNNPNGTADFGQEYLDRTLAHEFTHAVQISNTSYLPNFFIEGLAEITHGIDDVRTSDIVEMSSTSSNRLSTAVNLALTYNNGTHDKYAAGYMFWRYLAKQTADNYSSSSSSKVTTTVKKSKQVISDSDYSSSLWGGMSSNSTLQSAMSSIDNNLTVQDNLSSIDLGLSVDDISRQFSTDTGLIIADNSNSSLNMLDTSNITFGIQQKKNII